MYFMLFLLLTNFSLITFADLYVPIRINEFLHDVISDSHTKDHGDVFFFDRTSCGHIVSI